MKRIYLVLVFILGLAYGTRAQTCWESVEIAQQLFVSGDYTSVFNIVTDVLKNCDFTKAEREEALTLLAKANIELDNLENVDNNIRLILKENPNFKAKAGVQSEDFYKHVSQFKVIPLIGIGVKAAANLPYFPITKTFSVLDSVNYGGTYTTTFGYSVGGKLEIEPITNLSLTMEVMATGVGYERTLSKPTGWNMSYTERLSYLEIPLYLKKSFSINDKWSPYIIGGGGWLQLNKSYADISLNYTAVDPLTQINESNKLLANQVNQRDIRNINNLEWLAGLGVTYKLKSFRFSFDARFYGGVSNLVNANNRYGNSELIYLYNFIDNDIILNKIEAGVSVTYILKHTIKKMKDAKF